MKKIFTLLAAAVVALCANAETKTFGSADIDGLEKDNDVPCPGFTIPATYFAAGSSKADVFDGDKGMKVRTNKGADGNQFMIKVNAGCTITKLAMGMVVNDGSQTFSLSGISIDGTAVADFSAVKLPNTGDATGAAIVNLEGISAKDNITFTYDYTDYTGKNKQVFVAGEVTYEEGGVAPEPAGDEQTVNVVGSGSGIFNKAFESLTMPFDFNIDEKTLVMKNFLGGTATVELKYTKNSSASGDNVPGTLYNASAVSGLGDEETMQDYYKVCPINDFTGSLILKFEGADFGKLDNIKVGVGFASTVEINEDADHKKYCEVLVMLGGDYSKWDADKSEWVASGLNYVKLVKNVYFPEDPSSLNVVEAADENAPVEYFNLQGVRINEPAAGQIVIRRQGAKVTKMVVR